MSTQKFHSPVLYGLYMVVHLVYNCIFIEAAHHNISKAVEGAPGP